MKEVHAADTPTLTFIGVGCGFGAFLVLCFLSEMDAEARLPALMFGAALLAMAVVFFGLHALAWVLQSHEKWKRNPTGES